MKSICKIMLEIIIQQYNVMLVINVKGIMCNKEHTS